MVRTALAVTLVAGLMACADAPVSPLDGPSFDFSNAPEASGIVFRFEGQLAVLMRDEAAGLQAWHGWDVASFCQGNGGNDDLLSFQVHANPQEVLREMRNIHGDVQTSVWTFGPNSCARYASETPLATGISNFRGTDNDVTPVNRPNPKNRNAWGWMANGELFDADGNSLRYAATLRGTWDGSDPASSRVNTNIRLH